MTQEIALSILKLQTLSSISLIVLEENDWKSVRLFQSRFKNACKIIIEETERASNTLFGGKEQLSLQGLHESDALMDVMNKIIDATLNFRELEEEKASECLKKIKSILFDYNVSERDSDYVALYTLQEAKKILQK